MRNKKHRYSGMTLVETIVAIGIFSIGITGFTMLFVNAWKTNSFTIEMGQSSLAVSQSVHKMVNYIRGARQADNGAYPIVSASGNDLVIYSDYNKDEITERLHFYKTGIKVYMGVTAPVGTMPKTYPAGDDEVIELGDHIINPIGTPMFKYYNKNYTGGALQVPLTEPIVVSDVRLTMIHLLININPLRAPDNIEMQSFVEIRNLNDYDRIE